MEYHDSNYVESIEIPLEGAPIENGKLDEFRRRQRTLKFAMAPLMLEGAAWIDYTHGFKPGTRPDVLPEELTIYPSSIPDCPTSLEYCAFLREVYENYQNTREAAFRASSLSGSAESIVQYTTRFLSILDSWRRRIDEVDLSDCYTICHCLFAVYFDHESMSRAEAVMDWLNQSDPRPTNEEARDIMTTPNPSHLKGFWSLIHTSASRGLFIQCANCLRHGGFQNIEASISSLLQASITILETAPKGARAFIEHHRQWRAQAITIEGDTSRIVASQELSQQDSRIATGIITLMKLVRGDMDTILAQVDTWQECTAALFLLHDPTPSRLEEYFKVATETFTIDFTLASEEGCAAVFSSDLAQVFASAEEMDVCVAAHMADFCERIGMLDDFVDAESLSRPSIRDYLALRHGQACCSRPGLWSLGFEYLRDTEVSEGFALIRQLVTRIYPSDEQTVTQLLAVCEELGYDSERSTIIISWSKQLLSKGQVGTALMWLSDNGSVNELASIVWNLFEQALIRPAQPVDEPDPVLKEFMLAPSHAPDGIRDLIAPYAIYYQFRKLTLSDSVIDVQEPARMLSALIQFSYLPPTYLPSLIVQLTPLLVRTPFRQRALVPADAVAVMTAMYKIEQDKPKFEAGMTFLQKVLAGVSKEGEDETAIYFVRKARAAWQTVRNALIMEVSRGYLEGE
ncbi:Nup85 nucleoporin-domain-containing protein [Lipomyces oligophaga]|uniref:Nup85 nucleoporin-domain-containing protein n=1 Tax=Lipomyces oligophaga TaxID=45792 RepID=UPI0034CE98BC